MWAPKTKWSILAGLTLFFLSTIAAHCQDVSRISADELKANLNNPEYIVLDVRTRGDWDSSQWKIQGAEREDPGRVEQWKDKYPKDKTFVLYCD